MKTYAFISTCLLILLGTIPAEARRTHLTAEQKATLEKVQTIYVDVLALTEKGRKDSASLISVVKNKFEEIGYSVVTDRQQAHDVEFKVKCEERKTWTGTTASGGRCRITGCPVSFMEGAGVSLHL